MGGVLAGRLQQLEFSNLGELSNQPHRVSTAHWDRQWSGPFFVSQAAGFTG